MSADPCENDASTAQTLEVLAAFCKALRLAIKVHGVEWTIGLLQAALTALTTNGPASEPASSPGAKTG